MHPGFLSRLAAPIAALAIWASASAQPPTPPEPEPVARIQGLAQQGDANAQVKLGDWYRKGAGASPDWEKARFWYQKAAAQGHARGLLKLGVIYWEGLGVPQNRNEAVKLYLKSAALGDADAGSKLAYAYKLGVGVPKDDARALHWLVFSADLGAPLAQVVLGQLYEAGDNGTGKNPVIAYALYELAAGGKTEEAREGRKARAALEWAISPREKVLAQVLATRIRSSGLKKVLAGSGAVR